MTLNCSGQWPHTVTYTATYLAGVDYVQMALVGGEEYTHTWVSRHGARGLLRLGVKMVEGIFWYAAIPRQTVDTCMCWATGLLIREANLRSLFRFVLSQCSTVTKRFCFGLNGWRCGG